MDGHINDYWPSYLERMKDRELTEEDMVWVTSGITRILYTLSQKEICSKEKALQWGKAAFHDYSELLNHALELRLGRRGGRQTEKQELLAFAKTAVQRGKRMLEQR
ncbi:DUF4111 domain-containing protein [Halobacillus salinarum]|uniref:DUF4111 domain-containing protein n=1 Tax=Halobacillus salinarum TaxID=2932257 RepID=A0ABY4EK01_9BACI|nr:aminoglycoside adenylyltransferase domain-containing protein [Halobacillus salinarum]UOQ44760.1 DUF4111 domain-containing protein [Halobacillus salinarum]